MDSFDVVCREREFKRLRVTHAHTMHDVYLLNRRLHGLRSGQFRGHIDRPKLSTNTTRAQPGNIRVHGWLEFGSVMRQIERGEVIAALAILPRHIVVAVNERDLAQDAAGFFELAIRFVRSGRCGEVHGNKCDDCGSDGFDAHAGNCVSEVDLLHAQTLILQRTLAISRQNWQKSRNTSTTGLNCDRAHSLVRQQNTWKHKSYQYRHTGFGAAKKSCTDLTNSPRW